MLGRRWWCRFPFPSFSAQVANPPPRRDPPQANRSRWMARWGLSGTPSHAGKKASRRRFSYRLPADWRPRRPSIREEWFRSLIAATGPFCSLLPEGQHLPRGSGDSFPLDGVGDRLLFRRMSRSRCTHLGQSIGLIGSGWSPWRFAGATDERPRHYCVIPDPSAPRPIHEPSSEL